ncbi:sugar ABC transporter permease [Streptomyces sp. NBRC 109706]|uniref:sugar ABC transporter permease n=1 Tax=Streptomyces sp. NBRC 109706 TaxID=1550035 RepID=UPI000785DB97|nr:sugar ABC transporter permease [Streptomyces sp. NBRC 109706]
MATSTPVRRAPHPNPRARRLKRWRQAGIAVILTVSLAFVLFPLWYVVVAAFDDTDALGTQGFWPKNASLANFHVLVDDPTFPFFRWLWNTLKVSFLVAGISVVVTTMSAYAFSRFRFRGRQTLMRAIVLVQLFPNLLALIALYLMVQEAGRLLPVLGLNSNWTLVLIYLGGVLGGNVWLVKGYIDSLPKELDESAMVDGATHARIFWTIILPLARPMLAVIAVLSFVATYGELIVASVLITDAPEMTLPVGMWSYLSGEYTNRWGPFAAGAILAALPALLFFYLLQDWLVRGLTSGAVKS